MLLSELIVSERTVSLFGLAKNTGKTATLNAILRELRTTNRVPGVTSMGRDGEEYDVINRNIKKPTIYLASSSFVATTDSLLRKSGCAYQLLQKTPYRTPLGHVVIARMLEGGLVEIAGPNAAEDIRSVCDSMLDFGADCALIDGAINRKATSSPMIADGVVIATGAVLDTDVEAVVSETKNAVESLRLPEVIDPEVKAIAKSTQTSALIGENYEIIPLDRQATLVEGSNCITDIIRSGFIVHYVVVKGSLCESFVENLLKTNSGREIIVVIADSTRLFLNRRSVSWYGRQGLRIEVQNATHLKAITVNPLAPESHRFDSSRFRGLLQAAIPDISMFDVMDPSYAI